MSTEPVALDVNEAIQLYRSGLSLEEVASQLGVSRATIRRRIAARGDEVRSRSAAGHARRQRELGPTDWLRPFFDRYVAGETNYVVLAVEAGISPKRLRSLLVESGIPIRTQAQSLGMRHGRLTVSERQAMTEAANAAKRGRPARPESLERRALTMERTLQLSSREDLVLAVWLAQREVSFVMQKAEGIYNLDIAIEEPRVAVEVVGLSGSHRMRTLSRSRSTPEERRNYLFHKGWRLIEVRTALKWLRPACADRIVALLEMASPEEASWGQYCVIGGDGENAA